jgi:hypothetical protein
MATFTELFIDQGATFSNNIHVTDVVTNAYINVSGYSVSSMMRKSYTANVTANITCTIIDAANGTVRMSMTPANTANVLSGRYVYDVKTTDPNGVVNRVLEGIINMSPSVTR